MAFPTTFKPETIARHSRERVEATAKRQAILLARLSEKAAAEGPGSIWAEMLAEQTAKATAATE